MLLAPSTWELRVLEFRPLVAIGKVSYGLYLIHFPVQEMLKLPLGWKNLGNVLIVASISAGLSVLSYFAIERPFLSLKSRFRATPAHNAPPGDARRAA